MFGISVLQNYYGAQNILRSSAETRLCCLETRYCEQGGALLHLTWISSLLCFSVHKVLGHCKYSFLTALRPKVILTVLSTSECICI